MGGTARAARSEQGGLVSIASEPQSQERMRPVGTMGSGLASLGVVVPTLNEERELPRTLARLCQAQQAEGPLDLADRVVVADGGSRDGTLNEVARARERGWPVELVRAPRGRGSQLARGALGLASEVLFFLHADCRPQRGALRRLREAYRDPRVEVTALRQEIEAEGSFYRCVERCADWRSRRLGWVYGDSGLAVRRSAYGAVGGFRELLLFEDLDLTRRLARTSPVHLLSDAGLHVSARRWRREGALRCTLRNWMLLVAYLLGCDPAWLSRGYAPEPVSEMAPVSQKGPVSEKGPGPEKAT